MSVEQEREMIQVLARVAKATEALADSFKSLNYALDHVFARLEATSAPPMEEEPVEAQHLAHREKVRWPPRR